MGMKDLFKGRDTLTTELSMLPRETKRRILDNVNRRRAQIVEEKLLERQMGSFGQEKEKGRNWGKFKEGMQNRRKELTEKGILKPLVRVNRENFRSPMEEASKKARAAEIKRLEDQRNKMKSGSLMDKVSTIKIKELKLKIPKSDSPFSVRRKSDYIKDGII